MLSEMVRCIQPEDTNLGFRARSKKLFQVFFHLILLILWVHISWSFLFLKTAILKKILYAWYIVGIV